jgi:TolB-like protein
MFSLPLFVLLLSVPTAADQNAKPGLAALDIAAERGVDDSLVKILTDTLLSGLKSSGRFSSVIGSSDIQAMISMEQQKQALGCDEDSCLAQLGGALGVPYLVTGSLGTVGGRFVLNLKLLQVEDARVAERVTKVYDDEKGLIDGLNAAVSDLVKSVDSEQKSSSFPPQVASVKEPKEVKSRVLSGSLLAVGLGVVAASYAVVNSAQETHDEERSVDSANALESAANLGNGLLFAGLGSLAAGVTTWIW